MDLRAAISELLCEQGDIASDTVFTMVLLHFRGLGSAIFRQFCRKNGCCPRALQNYTSGARLFEDFVENVPKLVPQGGGQNLPKSIENPLLTAGGPPGVP